MAEPSGPEGMAPSFKQGYCQIAAVSGAAGSEAGGAGEARRGIEPVPHIQE